MSRERQYKDAAQKQAAYRARHPKQISQAQLASLARSIYWVIIYGFEQGDSPLPRDIRGDTVEQTLRNLMCYLDPVKDTIRYPDWNRFHPGREGDPDILDI